jgi:hypothetical protein
MLQYCSWLCVGAVSTVFARRNQAGNSARLVLKQVKNIFEKSPKTSCKAYCSGDNYKIDIAQNTLKDKAYGYEPVD